ncbi:lipoyl(octanoyl) transferase LipB [Aestuariibacter salexigens]|uniref:lipoyl(octanoyl) transferase LipB n=1 Tax=Aestuariibacter salexigens TaxID=226010 RepID=UPI0004042D9F|nr:lipoyl(octanoyl) transferase LipB [Aestuariibacter salexigens]
MTVSNAVPQVECDTDTLIIRQLGRQPYLPVFNAMRDFTDQRDESTQDEIWLVEHEPVFTQGQAGKAEHILAPGDIPVVQVDRGGQVTYHGPGQQTLYILLNMKRRKLGVRALVTALEQSVVDLLADYNIAAYPKADAPGVYVNEQKICSVGLRIRRGCSFHGLALNVNMDLAPFQRINPCGYAGLEMIDCARLNGPDNLDNVGKPLSDHLCRHLGIQLKQFRAGFDD